MGFALRFSVRVYLGAQAFWSGGYTLLFVLAHNIAAGKGIALVEGYPTAFRLPLYPIFLAAVTGGRQSFLPIVLAQSLIGAGTAWCAALLAAEMFGAPSAIIAAGLTAIYPYYVIHDTALQETGLFTLLTLVAVILLRRARKGSSGMIAARAGALLGADVMTRATILPFAVFAPLWLAFSCAKDKSRSVSLRAAMMCAAMLVAVISRWLFRSWKLTGAPVLSTETGLELWNGNNPLTFSHYPLESSDLSKAAALEALTPAEREAIGKSGTGEAGVDRWFWRQGMSYIRSNPWLTARNGLRKIGAAFGWFPSPRRRFRENLAYALSYGPVTLLGLYGMWLRRAHATEDSLIYAAFLCFAGVTAVFFGHSSHRAYLDVYWIVFAAGALQEAHKKARNALS